MFSNKDFLDLRKFLRPDLRKILALILVLAISIGITHEGLTGKIGVWYSHSTLELIFTNLMFPIYYLVSVFIYPCPYCGDYSAEILLYFILSLISFFVLYLFACCFVKIYEKIKERIS